LDLETLDANMDRAWPESRVDGGLQTHQPPPLQHPVRLSEPGVTRLEVHQRWLEAVRAAVLARPSEPFRVSLLAREHGMSRSHFTRVFHARTGVTPARFVLEVRLREATRHILETRLPLTEVARKVGFSSIAHFDKVFRRFYGMSPGAFRRAAS